MKSSGNHHTDGFSLIEVLIFITIFSFFFVTATAVVLGTIRDMRVNENRIRATQYANELVEGMRGEREVNWGGAVYSGTASDAFTVKASLAGASSTKYCFNQLDVTTWPAVATSGSSDPCGGVYGLNSIFKRTVEFNSVPTAGLIDQITVKVSVEWKELGNTYTSNVNTIFKIND